MKSKKIICTVLAFLMILPIIAVNSSAADTAIVYGETVNAEPDSILFVPVKIKNNTGVMGFKITVSYDPDILSLPAVTKGTVTESGMLNDSIGASPDGIVDIVWTGNSAVADDGTLFVISFNVGEVESEQTKIKLTYSQADTFNEQYKDVIFDCREAVIDFTGKETESIYTGEIREPDYRDVIAAVDSSIKEMPFESINEADLDFSEEFIEKTNEAVYIITGTRDFFSTVEEIIGAYKAAVAAKFVNGSCDAVDPEVIEDVIENALNNADAKTVDEIPDEKKEAFISEVEEKLCEQAGDIDAVSDVLNEDEAIEAIKALQAASEENQSAGTKIADTVKKTDNLLIKIMVAAVAAAAIIFAVIALIIRKRQKKNEEGKLNEKDN